MDRIKFLTDKRGELFEANEVIIAAAVNDKGEPRSFKDDEKKDMDANEAEIKTIDAELEVLKRHEERKKVVAQAQAASARAASSGVEEPDGEEKEIQKNFSYTGFLREANSRSGLQGFNREMHGEGEKEFSQAGVTREGGDSSVIIPLKVLNTREKVKARDMTAGTAAEGGNAIATELRSFIDLLTDRIVLARAGATFATDLVGNIDWPTEATVPTATWKTEVALHDESSPTVGKLSSSPERLGTFTELSNRLIRQTSPSIDARVRNQLIGAVQRGFDLAGLVGSGTPPEPEGITNTTGIGSVALGANGGAPTWAGVVQLEKEVNVDNALAGSIAYIGNAKVTSELKITKKDAGSGIFLLGDGVEQVLNGHRYLQSNLVPSNLVKGTSGAVCSALIFGNFDDIFMGMWGGIEVLANPYSRDTESITRMTVNLYADVTVLRAVSFSAILDMLTT